MLCSPVNEQVSSPEEQPWWAGHSPVQGRRRDGRAAGGGGNPSAREAFHPQERASSTHTQQKCQLARKHVDGQLHIIHLLILVGPQEPSHRHFDNLILLNAK